MSDSRPTPPESGTTPAPGTAPGTAPGGDAPSSGTSETRTTEPAAQKKNPDPLRGSATSGVWLAVVAFAVLLVLLAIFILQNTGSVEISFLGWTGSAPLAAMLLIASAAGALLVVMAGSLRIIQLRRRVRSERKQSR